MGVSEGRDSDDTIFSSAFASSKSQKRERQWQDSRLVFEASNGSLSSMRLSTCLQPSWYAPTLPCRPLLSLPLPNSAAINPHLTFQALKVQQCP